MSFRFYVGNYPNYFTKEDVWQIFKEFKSFKIDKFIKKENKSFSFCYSTDIDELVSIIKTKNDILVSGRRLKVRAAEDCLQDYVDLLIKGTDYDVYSDVQSTGPLEVTSNKCAIKQNDNDINDSVGKTLENYPTESLCNVKDKPSDDKSSFRQNHAMKNKQSVTFFDKMFDRDELKSSSDSCQSTSFTPTKVTTNKCDIKQDGKNGVDKNLENSPAQSLCVVDNPFVPSQVIKNQTCVKFFSESSVHGSLQSCDREDKQIMKHTNCEKLYTKNVESSTTQSLSDKYNKAQTSVAFFSKSSVHDSLQSCDREDKQIMKHANCEKLCTKNVESSTTQSLSDKCNELSWVSFRNFPFYTTIDSIYDFFSDFGPLKVIMILTKPTRNREQLSEAYVCFSSEDIAFDVILTFDNTMFNKRRVFVTPVNDMTVNNELLGFNFNS